MVYRHWRFNVLEKILEVQEIPKIISFSEHLMTRSVALYEEYNLQFLNVYKERVAQYLRLAPAKVVTSGAAENTNERSIDVEMVDESETDLTCAQTFDQRNRYSQMQHAVPEMMIIQQ